MKSNGANGITNTRKGAWGSPHVAGGRVEKRVLGVVHVGRRVRVAECICVGRSDPGPRSLCRSDDSAAGVRGVDEAVARTGRDRERERSERGAGFTPLCVCHRSVVLAMHHVAGVHVSASSSQLGCLLGYAVFEPQSGSRADLLLSRGVKWGCPTGFAPKYMIERESAIVTCVWSGNDPSAGSPTETLLRLHLPLNDEV